MRSTHIVSKHLSVCQYLAQLNQILRYRLSLGIALWMPVTVLFINSYSQTNKCASLLPEQSDLGYKRLSNRCEGFYNPRLSGNLQVVSFVLGGDINFTWNEKTALMISHINSLQHPLNIRAVSLQRNVFYQMDASLDKNESLEWPIGPFIYRRNIRPGQLGIYGWAGEEYDKTFSPVSIVEKGSAVLKTQSIVLKIRTVLNLTHFRWNLTRANGPICNLATNAFQAFEGDMSAGSIIEIKIPESPQNISSYCLEIQYRPDNGRWQSETLKIRI